MNTLTLEQLRALVEGGGVLGVVLTATGQDWSVVVEQRKGGEAVLVTTNGRQVRTFADPRRALLLLREMGVQRGRFEATAWAPEQRQVTDAAKSKK